MITQETSPDALLLQYGPLGAFALLATYALRFLIKVVIADKERERSRGDRLEAELKETTKFVQTDLIPAVIQMVALATEMNTNNKALMELVVRLQYETKESR